MPPKTIIGRIEKVSFPDLEVDKIQAKIDTGAYTSSIHCTRIKEQDGFLEFHIPLKKGSKNAKNLYRTSDFKKKEIKSSNGQVQSRYIIKTRIEILGKTYLSEFSLANRSEMKNAVLLGRKLLKGRFLVDVSLRNISTKNTKK